jgi:hypothetical protein
MKTIETLIAESEAKIGKELTQIILNNDIENIDLIFNYRGGNSTWPDANLIAAGINYKHLYDEQYLPAARLAAALGHNDLLKKFGFTVCHKDYSVFKTAIEHQQPHVLKINEIHQNVLRDEDRLKMHIHEAITNGDFHTLRYLAEQNPDVVMKSILSNFLFTRKYFEAVLFLVEIVGLQVPEENREALGKKMKKTRLRTDLGLSLEQKLLWNASMIKLGFPNRDKETIVPTLMEYIKDAIPRNCGKEEKEFDKITDLADYDGLDNTKVFLAYMYAQGLVTPEVMNDEQFIRLLNGIEIENLTTESIRYLGATFQFMLQETPDSVFTNGDASIDVLTKYYAFYSALISGDKEIAKNIFETLPEIERTGAAYYHYANILLDLHGMKSPDSECQDVLSLAYSALESAVKKGSDLAEKQLTFYQKGFDGSITRTGIPERSSIEASKVGDDSDSDEESYSNFRP